MSKYLGPIQRTPTRKSNALGLAQRTPTSRTSAFPRMSAEDYNRRLANDRSFEFTGHIIYENGEQETVSVFRRNLPELGIQIITRAQSALFKPPETPEGFEEYEIQIVVLAEYYQKDPKHCDYLVNYDTIQRVQEYLENYGADRQEIKDLQSDKGTIVFRIDDIDSPETREAVKTLHDFTCDLLEGGADLFYLAQMIKEYAVTKAWDNERVIPLQILEQDPNFKKLIPIVKKYFPGIDLEESSAETLRARVHGLLQAPSKS